MAGKLTVLNPEGSAPLVGAKSLAPRPASLAGKKIFLVDVGFENSSDFMDQLRESFARSMPDVRTVTVHMSTPFSPAPELYEQVRAEGDAAILGVGL